MPFPDPTMKTHPAVQAYAAAHRAAKLAPWTFEMGPPAPKSAVIRVLACGVCHSDIHMIDNDWACSSYPLVPGHEVVGIVESVGAEVTHLRPGDRVGVGWQRGSCGECPDCRRGEEPLCDGHKGLIVGHHGGFAEYVEVGAHFAFPLPVGVSTNDAGPLMCGGITVYSGLRHAGMPGITPVGTPRPRIGVIGIGGLGHMAVRFAAAMGGEVTAFTSSPDKETEAREHGAHEVIVTGRATKPKHPLDIILCTASGPVELDPYVDALASDGTLCIVGAGQERISLPFSPLLQKRRRVMASPIGGSVMMREMLDTAAKLGVRPHTEIFPMDEVNTAIAKVRANTIRYRAVLVR